MDNEKLYKVIEDGFEAIAKRLDLLEQRLDVTDKKFDRIENRLGAMEKRMDVIENRLDVIENRLDAIEKKNEEFRAIAEKRFDSLSFQLALLEQEVGRIGTVIRYNEQFENLKGLP